MLSRIASILTILRVTKYSAVLYSSSLWILWIFYLLNRKPNAQSKILFVAPDSYNITGSLGDVAMLISGIDTVKNQSPDSLITIIGSANEKILLPSLQEIQAIDAFSSWKSSIKFHATVINAKALYIVGADVLDGFYNPRAVLRLLAYANHASRCGVPVSILGFSFNKSPNPAVALALSALRHDIKIFVRDAHSLLRFEQATQRKAKLVADLAFLLRPTSPGDEIINWIDEQKEKDCFVVGLNINFHAFKKYKEKQTDHAFVKNLLAILPNTLKNKPVSYVLIPHDFKSTSGDVTLLKLLAELYPSSMNSKVKIYMSNNPKEIKGLMASLDFVFTGRMHLAIAALGMGTPVLCVDYQDKFTGLLDHFRLSTDDFLLTAEQCMSPMLGVKLDAIANNQSNIQEKIKLALGNVTNLSSQNFASRG